MASFPAVTALTINFIAFECCFYFFFWERKEGKYAKKNAHLGQGYTKIAESDSETPPKLKGKKFNDCDMQN